MTIYTMFSKDFIFGYFLAQHSLKIFMGITLMFECSGFQVCCLLAVETVFLSLLVYFPERKEL